MRPRRRSAAPGVASRGLPVDLEQGTDRLPGWSRRWCEGRRHHHVAGGDHRHSVEPTLDHERRHVVPERVDRLEARAGRRVDLETVRPAQLVVRVAGSKMGLVVGLLDRCLVRIRRGVHHAVDLLLGHGPDSARGCLRIGGSDGVRARQGPSRPMAGLAGCERRGDSRREEGRLDVVIEVLDGRPQLGQERSQTGRTGVGDRRIGDQHHRIGAGRQDPLIVGEGLHQVAQLTQTGAHGTGEGFVLEQELERGRRVGRCRHGAPERLI